MLLVDIFYGKIQNEKFRKNNKGDTYNERIFKRTKSRFKRIL